MKWFSAENQKKPELNETDRYGRFYTNIRVSETLLIMGMKFARACV